jgi:hypothetical protein
VGGGNAVSTSLAELTGHCQQATGRRVDVTAVPETAAVDLRIYVTDARRVMGDFAWQPGRSVTATVEEISGWVREHRETLASVLS